jgi:hypothetical protein
MEATAAAAAVGAPVAIKVASPDIAHKTEVGGVRLGVTATDAAAAFEAIMASARRHAPTARLDGVLVSPMISGGVECILGARIDPVFGPVVVFGLGGVFTEILKDVTFRRAPFGPAVARDMVLSLKGAPLLTGARGQPPVDLDALALTISRLSLFAAVHASTLESVEMNPLRAMPDGCVALDALIVTREEG